MCNKRKSVISVVQDGSVWRWRFTRPTKATVSTMGFLTQDEAAIDARSVAICEEALYQCVQCSCEYAPSHFAFCPGCGGLRAPADWPTYAEIQVIEERCDWWESGL